MKFRAPFNNRAEVAYLDAQTKLILYRRQLAKIIADHKRESKSVEVEQLAPQEAFYHKLIAPGQRQLRCTDYHCVLELLNNFEI